MPVDYLTSWWTNRHANVSIHPQRKYRVYTTRKASAGFAAVVEGMQAYQSILTQAERNGAAVRAFGGAWSLSEVPVTTDYMIGTGYTTNIQVGLGASQSVADDRHNLLFAQCGAGVGQIHRELWARGLALPTSGASDGQTIAGAISTGTHGAAHCFGSIQEAVVAIHLLTPTQNLWIERPSDPITTPAFRDVLGAELLADDETFDSLLVSFGSMGLIHAVVMRCVPAYKLRMFVEKRRWSDVRDHIPSFDVEGLGLQTADPWHVEVIVDPYSGDAYLRYMDKVAATEVTSLPSPNAGGISPSADLLNLIGALDGLGGAIVPQAVALALGAQFPETPVVGKPGELFGPTSIKGKGLSTEFGMSPADVPAFIDAAMGVSQDIMPLGAYAMRFVSSTSAKLGWTRFEPYTCTIETPMVGNASAQRALYGLWDATLALGIDHTFHWGQCLPLHRPSQVLAAYQGDPLDTWKRVRRTLLPQARHLAMFSNKVTTALDL